MLLAAMLSAGTASATEPNRWMREPIRWVQTNLRKTDAALNAGTFVDQLAAFDANVLLMQLTGISAFYPSKGAETGTRPCFRPATSVPRPPSSAGPGAMKR